MCGQKKRLEEGATLAYIKAQSWNFQGKSQQAQIFLCLKISNIY
jgi:hypothetical protein